MTLTKMLLFVAIDAVARSITVEGALAQDQSDEASFA